jgi:hypothetical protein
MVVKLVVPTLYSILYPVIAVIFALRTGSSQVRITDFGERDNALRFFGEFGTRVEFDVESVANA